MVLAFVGFIGVSAFTIMLLTAMYIYTEGAIAEIESKDDKW